MATSYFVRGPLHVLHIRSVLLAWPLLFLTAGSATKGNSIVLFPPNASSLFQKGLHYTASSLL